MPDGTLQGQIVHMLADAGVSVREIKIKFLVKNLQVDAAFFLTYEPKECQVKM